MGKLNFDNMISNQPVVTLRYLFFKLFKIGLVSFGGYMALVAMIQQELVEKDSVIEQEIITDAVSIASLLPGPVAVNIVAYIGYHLKNKTGAIVAVAGVLLPASLAMLMLSWCYFTYAYKTHWNQVLLYTAGAVAGIILTTGINMYKKEIKGNRWKNALCAISLLCFVFISSYLTTVLLIMSGGLTGYILKMDGSRATAKASTYMKTPDVFFTWKIKAAMLLLVLIEASYILNLSRFVQNIYSKIVLVFSGISLSLFGGGYVMVPVMNAMLVGNLKWLTPAEFLDGITFSQLTPGPILVSCIFTGYKLSGISGAFVALIATFGPSALLMIIVSGLFAAHKNTLWLRNALAGIKPVIIGLLLASVYKLLQSVPFHLVVTLIFMVTTFLGYKYKISPVYMIIGSLLTGACLTIFQFNI
jgi:chromate transporter